MDIETIHQEATAAAQKAAADMKARRGDGFPCGFAWVVVHGVKLSTKLGKDMKKVGFSKNYGGGIQIWNPSRNMAQNVDILLAGAEAYAAVLKRNGIDAYAQSRWD
jgi:hypothetical protein